MYMGSRKKSVLRTGGDVGRSSEGMRILCSGGMYTWNVKEVG